MLALNPRHYAALSGKGLCHACLKQNGEALDCFRGALELHPHLTSVKKRIEQLEQLKP